MNSNATSKVVLYIAVSLAVTGLSIVPIFFLPAPVTSFSSTPVQITFGHWNDIDPVSSPLGNIVAYSSNRSGSYQIFTIEFNGNHQTQLTAVSGDAVLPSFSPDGSMISFLRVHGVYSDLCFVSVSPPAQQWCATNDANIGTHYSWSQNSKMIVFDNGTRTFFYNLQENTTSVLNYTGSAVDPEFCGTSKLCFSGSINNTEWAIFISNLDGSNLTRLSWTGSDWMPLYNPVSHMLVYLANYTGRPEAWLVGANNTLSNVLFQVPFQTSGYEVDTPKLSASSTPQWNPSTDQVLVVGTFQDTTDHLVIVNATAIPLLINLVTYSVTPFSIVKSVTTTVQQAVWGPAGTSILYVSLSSGYDKLFLLNLKNTPLESPYG